jgi:hypothetical protein
VDRFCHRHENGTSEEKMTIDEARSEVETRLAVIERQNPDKELRPWVADACADASEYWGLVQQRIALSQSNPQRRACCKDLNLEASARTEAQRAAATANGARMAAARAA